MRYTEFIMKKNYIKIILSSILIPLIGVGVIDYFSHLFFSKPMETPAYFAGKMIMFFVFSLLFLNFIKLEKKEFIKVVAGGIIVASLWGIYYNILPEIFDFYPYGIALRGLTFFGLGLAGTGLAFGTVHTLSFVGGYYAAKLALKKF